MTDRNNSKNLADKVRVAEYVRMSTDHQQYSTENQADVIHKYAEAHNMEIVKTYSDDGKSGLQIKGREALQRLIDDVKSKQVEFEAILVYDSSRWGRFQDAEESAYYEFICHRNGISVHFCAELFENDGSPYSNMYKGFKRAMAGEYSRELSTKVFAGQCRLIELGLPWRFRTASPGATGYPHLAKSAPPETLAGSESLVQGHRKITLVMLPYRVSFTLLQSHLGT